MTGTSKLVIAKRYCRDARKISAGVLLNNLAPIISNELCLSETTDYNQIVIGYFGNKITNVKIK